MSDVKLYKMCADDTVSAPHVLYQCIIARMCHRMCQRVCYRMCYGMCHRVCHNMCNGMCHSMCIYNLPEITGEKKWLTC